MTELSKMKRNEDVYVKWDEEAIDTDYNFKGWDWTEISEALGIIEEDEEADEEKIVLEWVRNHLEKDTSDIILHEALPPDPPKSEVVLICKRYIRAMLDCEVCGYRALWEGLLDLEEDRHFLRAFSKLLPLAWT